MTIHYLHLSNHDLDIAYMWQGVPSTAPLVMLHGLGDSSIISFKHIAAQPTLAGQTTLLIDLPGFGYSPVPNDWASTTEMQARVIIATMETLGLSGVTLMGHSMGGSIAILIADQRPDIVVRLIVAEPLLQPENSTLGRAIAKRPETGFVDRGYGMLQLATRRQAIRGDTAAQRYQEPLSRSNPAILHRSAKSLLQQRAPSFLERLIAMTLPRTLLIGALSKVDTQELDGSGLRIARIPDAGHSMMSENPDGFAQAIAEALVR